MRERFAQFIDIVGRIGGFFGGDSFLMQNKKPESPFTYKGKQSREIPRKIPEDRQKKP